MSTPDVRVRLSAEGTADVVAALKKVQAEAETAGKKGSGGFLSMNKILGGTSALLGGLGIAVGITAIKSWIQSSLDAADAMGKMALKAGATTEHISALAMVAQTSDVEIDGLGSALARQNKFLADAASGSALAVSGLRNLRLGVTDFKGKDAVESFELISQAIMAIQDPARRVQAAMQIFGRTGADLIPTMQSLAEEGLGAVVTRATELGVLIDSKVSASAQQLNDDFKLLKLQVQGIGAHLGAGFAPQMSQSLQMMTGAVGQTTAAWQSFGVVIGAIVKGIVFAVSEAFDIVAVIVAGGAVVITALGQSIYHALTGHLKQAKQDLKTGLQGILDMRNDFADRLASRWNLLLAPPSAAAAGTRPNVANTGLDPTEQLAKRAAATARALDREVALARTKAGLRNAAEQRAFGEGLEDVHTYYDNRRRIAEQAYQDEIDAIGKRKTLLADEPDPDKRAEAAAKIDADAADLRLRHEAEIQTGIDEERNAVRELATERLGLEKNLLEAEGRRHEAALVGIEEELRKTDLLLRKQGVGEDERYAILARQRESLTAAADFDEIKRRGEQAMSDLGTARQAIQDQADAGMISQFEA